MLRLQLDMTTILEHYENLTEVCRDQIFTLHEKVTFNNICH